MYGDTGSTLHSGLETDRLIVEWRLTDPHVERILAGGQNAILPAALDAPIVDPDVPTSTAPHERRASLPTSPWVQVTVPQQIDEVKRRHPMTHGSGNGDPARVQWYLANGYRVESSST